MVSYIKAPAYKTLKNFIGLNAQNVRAYVPDLIFWGGAAGAGVATFAEGWPLFQQVFFQKIPYFGKHWIHEVDPEDIPV
ncbi:cytochrome b-c1 complex subunit 10 [Scheffersomyces xylosifermentans]|uniref:cytochrome b-c1 complex subunit 10 n=1 Tax=Scheffersomyces xylosifermentans TaxID=1304137 RepID=UPI00315CB9D7